MHRPKHKMHFGGFILNTYQSIYQKMNMAQTNRCTSYAPRLRYVRL